MKATNHPSDKMTIKNNNGDLLLEIDAEGVQEIKFKDGNEITGEDISSAIGKADTLPTVTSADAGRALVVDEDGKIVAGEAGVSLPKIMILQSELGNFYSAIGVYLATATDKIELSDNFFIQDEGGASIAAKIVSIIENGIGFVEFEGFGGQMFMYKVSNTLAAISPVFFILPDTNIMVNFSAVFTVGYVNGVPADVIISISKQKVNYSEE